jgi:hypothetical protein
MTITGAWRNWRYAEGLKPSVRKDLQVRILPPLPFIFRESDAADTADIAKRAYTYLLGMYLGDGHIARARKSYRLQIYLHVRNGDRIRRVAQAITMVLPGRPVALVRHGRAAVAVSAYWPAWPWLFPQHGSGRKHERRIVLEDWQQRLVAWYPEEFLRGCIESDGCRHRRIVRGRNYPAYGFCNRSEDILQLFGSACDALGLRWRRSSQMRISIARRREVARLDALLGYTERRL